MGGVWTMYQGAEGPEASEAAADSAARRFGLSTGRKVPVGTQGGLETRSGQGACILCIDSPVL